MFWDNFDTISKTEIYQSLQNLEPSQYELNYHVIIKALKYIFVAMSKGKNDMAMEFYNVILLKLIHINNYEIRKMVYIYILHYANYNSTTRDLSLLSINTFQKGLQDIDPMIRALALRVLTSIQLLDILPIQILAISKHVHSDTSVHVRQCAIMAIAKVVTRTHHAEQRQLLLELIQSVLQKETNINVLSSAMIAFYEYCTSPTATATTNTTTTAHHLLHESLYILHSCYYKLCHLICDMDEYIQVICLDVLGRYGRTYFQQPYYHGSRGSASMIDRQRRVTRPAPPLSVTTHATATTTSGMTPPNHPDWTTSLDSFWNGGSENVGSNISNAVSHPPPADHQLPMTTSTISRKATKPKTMTRRIIKKGFYSDEEDDSTEEEIEIPLPGGGGTFSSMATNTAFRDEDNININGMQDPSHHLTPMEHHNTTNNTNPFAFEEEDLHEDHRLLLHSVRPLFKSRNAGVVLAVCTLQYYCGVASIPIRKQIGKSLVRIYKSNNKRSIEIQYVVLSSIRQLVQNDCPSAFTPFLQDFFILPNIDPNFTRMIKLDILTYLSIDPPSIIAVLNELRSYVQIPYNNHSSDSNMDDVCFVCASIHTVGRVTEIARIVYDRHAQLLISSSPQVDGATATIRKYRTESNAIALNCLFGLITFSKVHDNYNENSMMIVGETIQVLQRILHLLSSSDYNDAATILDTNRVRDLALHRILLLLVNTLSCIIDDEAEGDEDDEANSDDDEDDENPSDRMNNSMKEKLHQHSGILPPAATASAIWLMGEYLGSSMSSPLSATTSLNGNSSATNPQQYGKFVNPQQRSKLCFELLRLLIRSFNMLDPPEKEQAIHFASKMLLLYQGATPSLPGNNEILSNIPPLCEHILALGRYDVIPDIRDRARFESSLIHYTVGLRYDTDGLDEASIPSQINNKALSVTDVQRIFLSTKPASTYLPLNNSDYNIMKDTVLGLSSEALEDGNFRFGTLSSLVGHKARSAYIPLPPWADKNSDSSLRAEKRGDTTSSNSKTVSVNDQPSHGQDFYQSSSDDDDEGDSTSAESSDSDSESSDDESEDDSDSDTDTDNQGDRPVGVVLPTQKSQHVNLLHDPKVPLSLPQQQPRPPIEIENASDESSSDDEDDEYDDDDEDKGPAEELFPSVLSNNETLIPIRNDGMVTPSSSVLEDMRGLVLESTSTQMNPSGRSDPQNDSSGTDAGGWINLVRPEHASGLLVEGRYLRDRKKIDEAQKVGLLPPDKPSITILQIRFTNQKSSTAGGGVSTTRSIRHIRLVQPSSSQPSSTSTTIGPRKIMIVPSEIPELSEQQSVSCIVGIDFWNTSDRDGSYSAKIEVKFGSGLHSSVSMDIKPTIGDMLVPYQKLCSVTKFDEQIRRMQGFSRIESHFTLDGTTLDRKTEKNVRTQLHHHVSERILSRAALTIVGSKQNSPNDTTNDPPSASMLSPSIRFIGILPSSLDPIYVVVSFQNDGTPSNNTTGTIMVCCDHALVANAFVQLLKRAIME